MKLLTPEQREKKIKEIQGRSNKELLEDHSFLSFQIGEDGTAAAHPDWEWEGQEIEKELLRRLDNNKNQES